MTVDELGSVSVDTGCETGVSELVCVCVHTLLQEQMLMQFAPAISD